MLTAAATSVSQYKFEVESWADSQEKSMIAFGQQAVNIHFKSYIPRLGMKQKPTLLVDAQTAACYKCRPRI